MSCSGPATFGQGNTAVYLVALSAFPLSSFRIPYNFASSGESVGERRRRKVPERMIQRDLEGFC